MLSIQEIKVTIPAAVSGYWKWVLERTVLPQHQMIQQRHLWVYQAVGVALVLHAGVAQLHQVAVVELAEVPCHHVAAAVPSAPVPEPAAGPELPLAAAVAVVEAAVCQSS